MARARARARAVERRLDGRRSWVGTAELTHELILTQVGAWPELTPDLSINLLDALQLLMLAQAG